MNAIAQKITRHPFFRNMKPEHLNVLTERVQERKFEKGEILFREGEPANQFYLIESGRVALEFDVPQDGVMHVQDIEAGDVLGWSWLFPPYSWHCQARAEEPTTAIVLGGAHLLVSAEENRDFGFELMKRIARVVIHRLETTRKHILHPKMETA